MFVRRTSANEDFLVQRIPALSRQHAVPVFAQESQPQASIVVPHSELSVVPDNDPITLDAADDEQSVIGTNSPRRNSR